MNSRRFFTRYALTITALITIMTFSMCSKDDDDNNNNNGLQYGTVKDIDGNSYKTIKIGTQTWMAENLKTTRYNNGDSIPKVTDESAWMLLNTPAYCWYGNDESQFSKYGALYTWYTAATGKLCPTGWRVPSDTAWTVLTEFLGGNVGIAEKLAKEGTTDWKTLTYTPTNETGFSALPGGMREMNGHFDAIGTYAGWWSSTEFSPGFIVVRYIQSSSNDLKTVGYVKYTGLSVRCIQE